MSSVILELVDDIEVQFVGVRNHTKLGPSKTYVKASGNTIHYMMPRCEWCGRVEVLSNPINVCMCHKCYAIKNRYNTALSQMSNWYKHHIKPVPEAYYYRLKQYVDLYHENTLAGFPVPSNLSRAERLCEFYEMQVLSEK